MERISKEFISNVLDSYERNLGWNEKVTAAAIARYFRKYCYATRNFYATRRTLEHNSNGYVLMNVDKNLHTTFKKDTYCELFRFSVDGFQYLMVVNFYRTAPVWIKNESDAFVSYIISVKKMSI